MANQRIIAGIEAQLAAKGLQKVAGNADLEVMYHGAVGHETQLNSTNMGGWGYGWGRYGGMGTTTTTVQNIPTGELDCGHRRRSGKEVHLARDCYGTH